MAHKTKAERRSEAEARQALSDLRNADERRQQIARMASAVNRPVGNLPLGQQALLLQLLPPSERQIDTRVVRQAYDI